MKRIVRRPFPPSRSRARAMTARTSSTRAETAESSSNAAPVRSATMRAIVVFPVPGRPEEDHRRWPVLLDRETERRALRRGRAPGRRARRACSAAGARRAARSRPGARGAASAKRSPTARSMLRAWPRVPRPQRGTSRGRGLLAAGPRRGRRSDYERYLNTDELLALQKGRGRVGAPRRAPLPGHAPVLRALAEARWNDAGEAVRLIEEGDLRGRPPPARPLVALPPLRRRAARHARAHVAVGVPGDPQGARPRLRLRLAGLERAAARLPAPRPGVPRVPPRGRALARGRSTSRVASTRSCTSSPRRSSSSTSRRSTGACGTTRWSRASSATRSSGRRGRRSSCSAASIATTSFPELWEVRNELTALSKAGRLSRGRGGRPARGGHGAAAGAAPREHGQPAGERDPRRGGAPRLLRPGRDRGELYAREPDRPNVVARLAGGDGPSLAFLSHTDTVLADPAEWDRDPWSGDLVDGEVWGRGALDMKGQVAASAVAFASLQREGFEPSGDLLFVVGRRRGGGRRRRARRLRAPLARRGAPRRGALRLRDQRGRRRPARARRDAGLPAARRRRRCPRRSRCACTGGAAMRRCPGSPTTRS